VEALQKNENSTVTDKAVFFMAAAALTLSIYNTIVTHKVQTEQAKRTFYVYKHPILNE